jgi:hypothetical protein
MTLRSALESMQHLEPELETFVEGTGQAKHPSLGWLNASQWIRIVVVHTHHHAKIIRDILRKATREPSAPPAH